MARLKDIFVETPSGGQPSGGAPPARQRRMPELAEREIQRKEAEDEKLEGEVVQDLNGDVHMKLSAPLVSRENCGAAKVCNCTVFQQREGAIIQKMQVAGRLYSDRVAEQVKRKNMGSPLTRGASYLGLDSFVSFQCVYVIEHKLSLRGVIARVVWTNKGSLDNFLLEELDVVLRMRQKHISLCFRFTNDAIQESVVFVDVGWAALESPPYPFRLRYQRNIFNLFLRRP